ncbi:MAG TPA: bifunctional glutamate N-acetyltransferase/amino-acid acetyltransferase ArgJ [Solirubrobacterales bacterium]|nr:bifunctional glutamate N-acetyltransferase/amino-acid acetyltransferase ArgJ [Solirubrobacterales bacterium]
MSGGAPESGESFFRSRWVDPPAGITELDPARLAPGFRAAGIACGIKGGGVTDVGLLVCDAERVDSALVLTRNASAAAPIRVCREVIDQDHVRAAVINSGNANAETGEKGFADALAMSERAADALGLETEQVAVAETGVIGVPMPMSAVLPGIEQAAKHLSADGGAAFADAIMTTDRWPKRVSLEVDGVTLSAQAKGGGMIQPNMATLLCFVQTDAVIENPGGALTHAVDASFNRITVDGQMSTNDTVLLQATGASGKPLPAGLLDAVLLQLAIEVIRDGEGAHRVGLVRVEGAADRAEAEWVARAIANSNLVKTALYGRDPNWGRIAQSAGAALAGAEMDEIGSEHIDAAELGDDSTEAEIGLRLSRGDARAHVYFSDLGHEYVTLNAEYTT